MLPFRSRIINRYNYYKQRCSVCGERVIDTGFHIDGLVFCTKACMKYYINTKHTGEIDIL